MDFPPTEWSLVLRASLDGSDGGKSALERLCRDYWAPVRDFLRSRGYAPGPAEDLTQDFFHRLIESRGWKRADRSRGKFRTFLLGMLMRVLVDQQRRDRAEKRGGGMADLSLEESAEPAVDGETALEFDSEWAAHLISGALDEVADLWQKRGRGGDFAELSAFLPVGGTAAADHEAAAARLGLGAVALRSVVHRLRSEFREAVRARIARTVSEPGEVAEEMEHLCAVMLQPGFDAKFAAVREELSGGSGKQAALPDARAAG